MHRPAHAANHFFVGGIGLEIKPSFIERLQQLIRGLKEERAQLGIAVFGKETHAFTSSRW